MRDIAAEAGVAVQTVYSSIGSKRSILFAFIDQMEEEAGIDDVSEAFKTIVEPGRQLDLRANFSRRIFDAGIITIEVMVRSAGTAPEILDAIEEGDQRHRESVADLITSRWSDDILRAGISRDEATDIVATLSGVDNYRWLVRRFGWSSDCYETWLARTLREAVLRDPGT